MRLIHLMLLGLVGLATSALPVQAAESYDNCSGTITSLPATIGTQGTWCMTKDLATSMTSGAAITVTTNNVTIDCNDFKLGGLNAGEATQTIGIRALNRTNITVRNCSVRGFRVGVYLQGSGSGHLLEDSRLDGNRYVGAWLHGDGNMIRGNTVANTGFGPSNEYAGIVTWGDADIIDNTVDGVFAADATNGSTYGIVASDGSVTTVLGNRVRNIAPNGSGIAVGIWIPAGGQAVSNQLIGPGTGTAIYAFSNNACVYKDNISKYFETQASAVCTSGGGNVFLP